MWVVRLWEVDRPYRRVVSTATLLRFAQLNRLPGVAAEIRSILREVFDGEEP